MKYAKTHKSIKIPFFKRKLNYFCVAAPSLLEFGGCLRWTISHTAPNRPTARNYSKWKSIWWSASVAAAQQFLSLPFWWQQCIRWIIKSNASCANRNAVFVSAMLYSRNCITRNRLDVMNLEQRAKHTPILNECKICFYSKWTKVARRTGDCSFFPAVKALQTFTFQYTCICIVRFSPNSE